MKHILAAIAVPMALTMATLFPFSSTCSSLEIFRPSAVVSLRPPPRRHRAPRTTPPKPAPNSNSISQAKPQRRIHHGARGPGANGFSSHGGWKKKTSQMIRNFPRVAGGAGEGGLAYNSVTSASTRLTYSSNPCGFTCQQADVELRIEPVCPMGAKGRWRHLKRKGCCSERVPGWLSKLDLQSSDQLLVTLHDYPDPAATRCAQEISLA